jgi:hypothetical protein
VAGPRLGTTGELAAHSSRQLGLTEGGLAYAAVVTRHAGAQQPSGTHKPPTMCSGYSEAAASSEAAHRRMSQGVMCGPLCGMHDGTTSSAHVATNVAPAGKRQNKTPIYVSGLWTCAAFCGGFGHLARVC